VQEDIKDRLLDELKKHFVEWTVGDPFDPSTRVGAMIEKRHLDKVMGLIARGLEEGAQVTFGGNRVLQETGGYFVQPTIFEGVTNAMTVAREEIFGPVLSVISVKTEEEAVRIANDTNYGLASQLYTDDLNRAHRVAKAVRAGTVSVNCFSEGDLAVPFGGYKESGFGGREKGLAAHDQYTEQKAIWIQIR
jgi:gamma-glutamyl-gamma-aminobutyraldehyde dehydrogenase